MTLDEAKRLQRKGPARKKCNRHAIARYLGKRAPRCTPPCEACLAIYIRAQEGQ